MIAFKLIVQFKLSFLFDYFFQDQKYFLVLIPQIFFFTVAKKIALKRIQRKIGNFYQTPQLNMYTLLQFFAQSKKNIKFQKYIITKVMSIKPHKILYEDKDVTLTDTQIIIKKYFFPFSFNKSFSYHEIKDVFLLTRSTENKQQVMSYLNPFGPSTSTYEKISYIELWLKNSSSHPTFQPQNSQQVFNIIRSQLRQEQIKQNINLGLDNAKKTVQKGFSQVFTKIGKFIDQTSDKIGQKGHELSEQFVSKK